MSREILVLGAGMVGVSTALALRERGYQVALVDRQAPGRETSYGNAGFIQREAVQPYAFPRDWKSVLRVIGRRGNDVHYHPAAMLRLLPVLTRYWRESAPARYAATVTAYAALIAHCLSEHQRLLAAAGADDLVSQRGWLEAYHSQAAFEAAVQRATAVAGAHGLALTTLDSAALRAEEPAVHGPLAGALHWRDPWTVSDPGEVVQRYASLFARQGGSLHRGDAATLRADGNGWCVGTDDGVLRAGQAVIALGPWASTLTATLGYRMPLFIKRGYHRHYAAPRMPTRPMLVAERGFVLAPMQRGLRVTTGAEFARHEARPTPRQLEIAAHDARMLLDLGAPVEPQPWMGARPCVADMRPVVGRAPRHRGLWFHFGHGHQGFTLGPVTARLLADLIDGTTPYLDPAPYDPARFAR